MYTDAVARSRGGVMGVTLWEKKKKPTLSPFWKKIFPARRLYHMVPTHRSGSLCFIGIVTD